MKRKTVKIIMSWAGLLLVVVFLANCIIFPGKVPWYGNLTILLVGVILKLTGYFLAPYREGEKVFYRYQRLSSDPAGEFARMQGTILEVHREEGRVKVRPNHSTKVHLVDFHDILAVL